MKKMKIFEKKIQGDKNTTNYESSYKNIWKNKGSCDAGYKLEIKCTLRDYHFDNLSIEESVIRSLS